MHPGQRDVATFLPVSATVPDGSTTLGEAGRGTGHSAPSASRPAAVAVEQLSKMFRLPHEQYHTLKERALHPFRPRHFDVVHAVDDVTVHIAQGEFFGIVGRNGSGKSTLLKCLAGIYKADVGSIAIAGRLSPFIELGVGFNPELVARDNVIINAVMLGLSRKEAYERFDSIVAFAELEEFMDLKLKNYSSGMMVRLAFAVAVQVDADVLLVDEVLAVGDASFQQKCFDEFSRLKSIGRTIVFVTHDMGSVERFCDRAMLLERGKIVDVGDPVSIARQYNELNFRRVRREAIKHGGPEVFKRDPVAEILDARFEKPNGERIVSLEQGEPCCVSMDVRFHADAEDPLFAIALRDERGHSVFGAATYLDHGPTGRFAAGRDALVRVRFDNWLAPGRYSLMASVNRNGPGHDSYDTREDIGSLIVSSSKTGGGIVDLPHRFEIERL